MSWQNTNILILIFLLFIFLILLIILSLSPPFFVYSCFLTHATRKSELINRDYNEEGIRKILCKNKQTNKIKENKTDSDSTTHIVRILLAYSIFLLDKNRSAYLDFLAHVPLSWHFFSQFFLYIKVDSDTCIYSHLFIYLLIYIILKQWSPVKWACTY